jgi:hypothetical protein
MFYGSQLLDPFAIKPYKLLSVQYEKIEIKELSNDC